VVSVDPELDETLLIGGDLDPRRVELQGERAQVQDIVVGPTPHGKQEEHRSHEEERHSAEGHGIDLGGVVFPIYERRFGATTGGRPRKTEKAP
jgi:hypothetical protein